jgi:hypothetical protein
MNNSIITNNGKKIALNRTYTETSNLSATLYKPITQMKIGINNNTPLVTDTDLDLVVPIENGTVCDDGDNNFTGSSGGDNSTDNTTTYKEGAGVTDATSQNLIANDTNATKIWTIADLAAEGTNCDATKYIGIWFYIKDATALAKFKTSGTCLEFRIGVDSTTNYYSKTYEASSLTTGWNFLGGTGILSTWDVEGTPGTLNDFQIRVITNNATDTFVAGDVLFDLLRQWTYADTVIDIETSYPVFDYTNLEVTIQAKINTLKGNGFNINGLAWVNEDSTPLMSDEDTFNSESKSSSDELIFETKNRIL